MDSISFLGLGLPGWITIVTVIALFLVLLLTKLSEDIAFLGAMAILGLSGILDQKEDLAGFSSDSVVLVGVLFIVVAGLIHTGVIRWIMQHFLGTPKSYPAAIVRLMTPVAALSTILSNTTVVALFVQVVKDWAKKLGIAPSKLLIPLSYAAGMGGICTIIGTPPNMIIAGLYAQNSGQHIGFFAPTLPGIFCLVVGVLATLAMRKLLPVRESREDGTGKEAVAEEAQPQIGVKTVISALIMLAMILLSSFKVMSLLQSAVVAAAAMLIFRCCTPSQAMKSIDWSVLMIFAGSVVIGTAIQKTGVAEALANGVMRMCGSKPLLVMIMMSLTATFVTEFISNTAAGAIFFPIVYHAAVTMGCDPMPFLISLMIAVSSSFATPIGSTTHLLVYGPGGYKFSDFMKIGIPMNLIILAANILIVNLIYPL
jgi:Di- and tricarboxylate transporters